LKIVRIAAVVCVVGATASAQAGPCKYHHDLGFLPAVLTPDHVILDPDGGVVVAAESVRLDRAVDADPTLQDWRFSDGAHDVIGKRTVIAPGLIVTAPVGLGDALVFQNPDGSRVRQIRYHSAAGRAALPSPQVESVIYSNTNLGIMRRELTTAKLAAPPPAGVVALVVYAGSTPRSWVAIDGQRVDVAVYAVDDCVRQIPGTIPTRAGDRVTLAWVDRTGHVSAHTAAMVVGKR
jgi:hypothetical protein